MVSENDIFIPGNTPSSKNSKVWTGKFLVNSKTVTEYKNNTTLIYRSKKVKFRKLVEKLPYPYKIGFYFTRDSKRRWDFINIVQCVADLMVDEGWIDDDDVNHFIPVYLGYEIDKKNPGVRISVLVG